MRHTNAAGQYDAILISGQDFGTIATTNDAWTTFPHTHLMLCTNPTSILTAHATASNPLLNPAVGNSDPGGNNPAVGPLFIKQSAGNYVHHSAEPNLYGKIEIIAQITDHMGHLEPNPGDQIDPDAWPNPANRFHGITSSPFKIEYEVEGPVNSVPQESYEFSSHPDDAKLIVLNEHDKDVDGNPGAGFLAYNYCFNVTNLTDDRYWNTKLKKGQNWNGTDAKIPLYDLPDGPQYPDGKYTLKINGKDVANHEGILNQELTVDNFRPYVHKVTIGSEYQAEWNFKTDLNFNKSISKHLESGTYTITIEFSEPITQATLSIDTFNDDIPLESSEPGNIQITWTGTLNIPENGSSHDGQRTMTIEAEDLASNPILKLKDENSFSASWLSRDPNIDFNFPGNPDGSQMSSSDNDQRHKFTILTDDGGEDDDQDGLNELHPDESEDISGPSYPDLIPLAGVPRVLVLKRGAMGSAYRLLNHLKIPCVRKETNFSADLVKIAPILVVPTGGFLGLDNSPIFKQKIAEYVSRGGTLIMFAQQHGYEFSSLPVPEGEALSGYGWNEDQSCHSRAVYIDNYNPMFAGQDSSTLDASVDGYFDRWPSDATILLRRTKNGMPAMIEYDYGQGKVVASTLYSDWAYGHQQLTRDEFALVRDLISWATDPHKEIPEYMSGEGTVELSVNVINFMNRDASEVVITLIDPDRNIIDESTIAFSVPAGESAIVPFSYPTPEKLGIWWVDYTLLDSDGTVIQHQTEGERFAVRQDIAVGEYILGDFQIWAVTPSEGVIRGSIVTYTIYINNNTDQDFEGGNISIFAHEAGGEGWDYKGVIPEVNISANSQVSFNFSIPLNYSTTMHFGLFAAGEDYMAYFLAGSIVRCMRWVWLVFPEVSITAKTDEEQYGGGEDVSLLFDLQNKLNIDYSSDVKVSVTNPDGIEIFEDSLTVTLPPSGSASETLHFTLPDFPTLGIYWIWVKAYYNEKRIGFGSTYFKVPEVQFILTPSIPEIFGHSNNISFRVDNVGQVVASGGTLNVIFSDPDGAEIWTGSENFGSLPAGQSITLDFIVSTGELKFGDYELNYTLSYDEKTIDGKVDIPCSSSIKIDLDKNSYRVREDVSLTVEVTNTGKFVQDLTVIADVPDCAFTDTRSFVLNPNESETIPHLLTIPETIDPGADRGFATASYSNSVDCEK